MSSDSSPFAEEAPTEAEAVRRDDALDAADLSHDRGADAALEHDIGIIESALRQVGSMAADASWPRLVERLRAVPAPTLPAPDAVLSKMQAFAAAREADGWANRDAPDNINAIIAVAIREWVEALRDAV